MEEQLFKLLEEKCKEILKKIKKPLYLLFSIKYGSTSLIYSSFKIPQSLKKQLSLPFKTSIIKEKQRKLPSGYKKVYEITRKSKECSINLICFIMKNYKLTEQQKEKIKEIVDSLKETVNLLYKIEERERYIISIGEYTEILDFLTSESEIALRSLFLTFSAEAINANRVTFYYYEEENKILYPSLTMVYKKRRLIPYDYYTELKDIIIKHDEDVCGYTVQKKVPVFIENVEESEIYKGIVDKRVNLETLSIIAVPLIIDGLVIGVIELASEKSNKKFSKLDFSAILIISRLTVMNMERSKLFNWAITDELTQLYNYHYLQLRLEQEISRIKRYPAPLSIVMIDVDNFKKINDNFGHPFGNYVLKEVANIIKKYTRNNVDIPIRYGGDEFLLILPQTDLKGAVTVAERIRKAIEEHKFEEKGITTEVRISGGVAGMNPEDTFTKEELIKKADDALYRAKKAGKNRVSMDLNL